MGGRWAGRSAAGSPPAGVAAEVGGVRVLGFLGLGLGEGSMTSGL